MSDSTAQGLRGGGALLAAVSLLLPWYVLKAGSLNSGVGKSGADALGGVALLLPACGLVAGWTGARRIHPLLPIVGAAALALIVLVNIASPPSAASAITQGSTDPLAKTFAGAFTASLGLAYSPAWGIWVAASGAAMAVVGAIADFRR